MTKVRRSLLKDTVAVTTYAGENAYGPVFAASTTASVIADQTRRLVRARDGREVVSELTLYAHPDDGALFTPESVVTYGGRESAVLTVAESAMRGSAVLVKVTCA